MCAATTAADRLRPEIVCVPTTAAVGVHAPSAANPGVEKFCALHD